MYHRYLDRSQLLVTGIKYRLDADPDPTFHFDVDTDPDPDPTPSFTHVRKSKILFRLLVKAVSVSVQCQCQHQRCHNFQYLQYIEIVWKQYCLTQLLVAMGTDTHPAPDRQALDAVYQSYPFEVKLLCRPCCKLVQKWGQVVWKFCQKSC
jgi:hypothetical protein